MLEDNMKIIFDDSIDFLTDLENLTAQLDRWNKPLVVVPTMKDVRNAEAKFEGSHITFISYDYWLSKKWIVDDNYDHIDFYRIDQFFINKCYGTRVGVGTMKRIMSKKKEEN